jgi:FKBP-type peptidyl-prolyl cis-trans isomerase
MNRTNISRFLAILLILFGVSCRKSSKNEHTGKNRQEVKQQLEDVNRILIKKDHEVIKGYVKRQGWNMSESPTGLWFEIIQEGTGKKAQAGLTATLNYKVSLLDGALCYDSQNKGPKSFLIGQGNVESGLEEGILLLSEGSKARFIMPPYLAHGLPGDGDKIPARTIIVYEVELLSLSNQ